MKLYRNIGELLTLQAAAQKQGRNINEEDLSIIKNAALLVDSKNTILWVGSEKTFPKKKFKISKVTDCKKNHILPGFVESHTHSIFAGNRINEFEMRMQGASYQEIAATGGGIQSTVKATRAASPKTLLSLAQKRVDEFVSQGVTTLEVKSGYALNEKDELKMLKVAAQLKGCRIVKTFLGAHGVGVEFSNAAEYLEFLENKMLPQIQKKKLASRVDIFIEKNYFDLSSKKYLQKAKELGFDLVIHADQLSLSGGSQLAVELGAKSADHLLQIEVPQIEDLAKSKVTCVLLPTADLYMKMKYPPAKKLIAAGARIALATDFNPGSSPTQNLTLVGVLARLEMGMSLAQVIVAYTLGGAFALGLENQIGSLEVGKRAEFIQVPEWRELFYSSVSMPICSINKAII